MLTESNAGASRGRQRAGAVFVALPVLPGQVRACGSSTCRQSGSDRACPARIETSTSRAPSAGLGRADFGSQGGRAGIGCVRRPILGRKDDSRYKRPVQVQPVFSTRTARTKGADTVSTIGTQPAMARRVRLDPGIRSTTLANTSGGCGVFNGPPDSASRKIRNFAGSSAPSRRLFECRYETWSLIETRANNPCGSGIGQAR